MLYWLPMMRLVAVALLALMCVDLGMDMLQGERGDSDSDHTISAFSSGRTILNISADTQRSGQNDSEHECFCCCNHVEQESTTVIAVIFESSPNYSHRIVLSSEPGFVSIYHPPQSIS